MRILISAIHYPVASGRYVFNAFKRLGHDVRSVGVSTGANIWSMAVDPRHVWEADGDLTTAWPDWTPDLVVHMDSAYEYRHPVYAAVPHVIYGVDNHVRRYSKRYAQHLFLAHKEVSLQPFDEDTTWLPCGYDPIVFKPSHIPWEEREYDVCMIGVMYPQREKLLNALAAAGLKVVYGTGVLYEDCAALYQNSRISLCASAAGDVAQRIFETAACGCSILTDPLPDLQQHNKEVFKLNGWASYTNASECVDIALELLDKKPVTEAAALVGQDDVIMEIPPNIGLGKFGAQLMMTSVIGGHHTWDDRAKVILDWYARTYPTPEPLPAPAPDSELMAILDMADRVAEKTPKSKRKPSE